MSLLARLWSMLTGRAERALEEVESPDDKLHFVVRRAEVEVRNLENAVTGAVTEEKRLKLQLQDLVFKAGEWEKRATLAINEGQEGLAREALEKKAELDDQIATMGAAWEKQKAISGQLIGRLRTVKGTVEAQVREYRTALARYQAAQASKRIAQTMTGNGGDGAMRQMQDLNNKILKLESEAEATLAVSGHATDVVEQRFVELEKGKRIDAALAKLKASGPTTGGGLLEQQRVAEMDRTAELRQKLKAG